MIFFFFFQAEDGIRDVAVTGVQTCALPIWSAHHKQSARVTVICSARAILPDRAAKFGHRQNDNVSHPVTEKIGRASCRKSVDLGGRRIIKKKKKKKTRH